MDSTNIKTGTDEMIDIITAYRQGKTIEMKCDTFVNWTVIETPGFNFVNCIYRIQTEHNAITIEQAKAYLKNRGDGCPVCKASSIAGGSYNLDTGTIYQGMHCTECDVTWDDAYELDRIVNVD